MSILERIAKSLSSLFSIDGGIRRGVGVPVSVAITPKSSAECGKCRFNLDYYGQVEEGRCNLFGGIPAKDRRRNYRHIDCASNGDMERTVFYVHARDDLHCGECIKNKMETEMTGESSTDICVAFGTLSYDDRARDYLRHPLCDSRGVFNRKDNQPCSVSPVPVSAGLPPATRSRLPVWMNRGRSSADGFSAAWTSRSAAR